MSSPAGTPNSKATVDLTAREIELLGFAMQSMKDPNVQIDYDKFAKMGGLTLGSAKVTWGKIRRKLAAAASGPDGTPGSAASQAAKSKGRGGGRKRKTEDAGATGGDGDTSGSPQSPTAMATDRKKKRANKFVKAEVPAQAGEEDGIPMKVEGGVQVKSEGGFMVKAESNEGGF